MDSRRDFLKKAMLLSGAGGLDMMLPSSIQRALAINPEQGSTFLDAEHIVILMQENRSFDHCFGSLKGVRGLNDPRAVRLPDKKPVWFQTNELGETYAPFRLNIHDTKATWLGDLPHSRSSQVDAYNSGKYDQWLNVKKSTNKKFSNVPLTLGQYTRKDLPFHYALADAFTICDQNFSSAMTSTTPNRSFFWTGKITHPVNGINKAHIRNPDFGLANAPWGTFPELLEDHGISWRFYQNALSCGGGFVNTERSWLGNFGGNVLEFFSAYHVKFTAKYVEGLQKRLIELPGQIEKLKSEINNSSVAKTKLLTDLKNKQEALDAAKSDYIKWGKESFEKLPESAKSLYKKAFVVNDGDKDYRSVTTLQYDDEGSKKETDLPKGDILYQFRNDVRENKLPTVSWLASPQNFSDHPSAPWYGAWYVSEVIDILTENPEIWKKTIFILTYDENDGFFDHIPPFSIPDAKRPDTGKCSDGIDTEVEHVRLENELKQGIPKKEAREAPIGLGFRVPMFIVSPWSRGGKVCSEVFDHTSTLQFLEKFVEGKFKRKLHCENISRWRRTICGDLTSAFSPYDSRKLEELPFLDQKNFITSIYNAKFKPDPTSLKKLTATDVKSYVDNPLQSGIMLKQERGMSRSCALPYDLAVTGRLSEDKSNFIIDFSAGESLFKDRASGSPFTVYAPGSYKNEVGADEELCRNWSFAVKRGDTIDYSWPLEAFAGKKYHLRVHGPNGFYREFLGTQHNPALEVTCKPELDHKSQATGNMLLELNNRSSSTQHIKILDHGYKVNGQACVVQPFSIAKLVLNLKESFHWYDYAIVIDGVSDFEQRYAGRIETGTEGFTDPKMA